MIWRLIVDIYEECTTAYPVVTHIFNGRTRKEAEGDYEAHLRAYAVKRWEKAPLGG